MLCLLQYSTVPGNTLARTVPLQCGGVLASTRYSVQSGLVSGSVVQYSTVQNSTVEYSTVQYSTVR